jgi:hypothetical protein
VGLSDRSRWANVGFPLLIAVLVAVAVAVNLGDDEPSLAPGPPTGSAELPSSLAGEWSGDGALTDCAGFDDEDCSSTRSITLTIDCSAEPCLVTPFDRSYGRPPLRPEDGGYRAAGPVPAEKAPTCNGTPTSSALWRLEVAAAAERLEGSYTESTLQGFDCGATHLRWEVTFERR